MLPDRFWDKVGKGSDADSCWVWTGAITSRGYGCFRMNGKVVGAHRLSYEDVAGPIPDGLQIDHLCRVRCCVNPMHLEAVSQHENILRGESGLNNSIKTHCKYGHAFSEDNTRIYKKQRYCRACNRNQKKIWRENASNQSPQSSVTIP